MKKTWNTIVFSCLFKYSKIIPGLNLPVCQAALLFQEYAIVLRCIIIFKGHIPIIRYLLMMKSETVEIELDSFEFRALKANRTISDMCAKYLKPKERRGGFIVLNMTKQEAEFLLGWVAAEANHAESEIESKLLNSACDAIELHI